MPQLTVTTSNVTLMTTVSSFLGTAFLNPSLSNQNANLVGGYLYEIAQLKLRLAPGRQIIAADINRIAELYNLIVPHRHTATDTFGIQNFGNQSTYLAPPGSTTTVETSTSGMTAIANTAICTVSAQIQTSDLESIRTVLAANLTHSHTLTDTTS